MLVTVALASIVSAPSAFVRPDGNDANPCTQARPCASLARAVTTGARTVELLSGRYHVHEALRLTSKQSGLTIRGHGKAVLDGGISLTRSRKYLAGDSPRIPTAARTQVQVFDLMPATYGELQVRGFIGARPIAAAELYANAVRLPLAGWPNGDWARTGDANGKDEFQIDARANGWGPGGWLHGYWMFDWADLYRPIIQLQNGRVKMGGDAGEFGLAKGRRYRALNLPEELDAPGEWWRDSEAGKLYVWPTGGELALSVLGEPFIRAEGIDRLTIENVAFEFGRANAISVVGGSDLRIQNCLIRGMGTDGIRLEGTRSALVRGCDLTELGEGGMFVAGGDRATLTPGGNVVEDCQIWNFSRWARTYRPGIMIEGVGNQVARCEIRDAPHTGILLSGNDHRIEGCKFTRLCRETGDAGAVYMGRDTTMRGVIVEGNLFRDIGPLVTTEGNYTNVIGVYLDDCWAGTTVRRNIFDIRGQGVMVGGGRDNLVEKNLFIDNHPAISVDQRGIGWAKDFFKDGGGWNFFDRIRAVKGDQPPYSTKYPPLARIMQVNAALAEGNVVRLNASYGGKWLELLDGATEALIGSRDNDVRPAKLGGTRDLSEARRVIPDLPRERDLGLQTRSGRPFERMLR